MLAHQVTVKVHVKEQETVRSDYERAALSLALVVASSLSAQVTDKQSEQPPGSDWFHYNGSYDSQRHSQLNQIKLSNVSALVSKSVYHVPGANNLESVPIVVSGVMYLTQTRYMRSMGRSRRLILDYHHILNKVRVREGPHRGAAVFEDKVYFTTTMTSCLL